MRLIVAMLFWGVESLAVGGTRGEGAKDASGGRSWPHSGRIFDFFNSTQYGITFSATDLYGVSAIALFGLGALALVVISGVVGIPFVVPFLGPNYSDQRYHSQGGEVDYQGSYDSPGYHHRRGMSYRGEPKINVHNKDVRYKLLKRFKEPN